MQRHPLRPTEATWRDYFGRTRGVGRGKSSARKSHWHAKEEHAAMSAKAKTKEKSKQKIPVAVQDPSQLSVCYYHANEILYQPLSHDPCSVTERYMPQPDCCRNTDLLNVRCLNLSAAATLSHCSLAIPAGQGTNVCFPTEFAGMAERRTTHAGCRQQADDAGLGRAPGGNAGPVEDRGSVSRP